MEQSRTPTPQSVYPQTALKCHKCKTDLTKLITYNGRQYCEKCIHTITLPCEVWARVVGYMRPVSSWNNGKQQEFKDRRSYLAPQGEINNATTV